MTKVLFVVQQLRRPVPGGIGTSVRGLVQGLRATGATGVTAYAGRGSRRPDPLVELGLPLHVSAVPARLLTPAWDLGLLDVPRGYQVVHTPSLETPPVRHGALVVTINDLAWREVPDAFPARGRRWHEAALRRALHRADAVIVPSPSTAAFVRAAGAQADSVHVVALGSDHLPPPDDDGARAVLEGLGVHGAFIMSVGTLEPRKNLGRLIAAYDRARRQASNLPPLVVVGPRGWTGSGLERRHDGEWEPAPPAPGAIVSGGVHFAGEVGAPALAALYRRARLLAFVPLLEGFGLPPLEAMAAGIPVLSSPVPSVCPEHQWAERPASEEPAPQDRPGPTLPTPALLVDPLDVASIADGLVRANEDAELRARLSALGAAHAAAHTWAHTAQAYLSIWDGLAAKAAP